MVSKVAVYRYELPDSATEGAFVRPKNWATERLILERGGRILKLTAIDVGIDELETDGQWMPVVPRGQR